VLHSLKYLVDKYSHDITLACFKLEGKEYPDLSRYCHIETVDISQRSGIKSLKAILSTLKTIMSLHNIASQCPGFLHYNYSPEMNNKVKTLLDDNYDILMIDHPAMIRYLPRMGPPAILLEAFNLAEISRMKYELEKNWLRKILRLIYHYQTKGYGKVYQMLDAAIAVSNHQMELVKLHCPDLSVKVIPYGIDMDYFHEDEPEADVPSLIITGSMSGSSNITAVMQFYQSIFPIIKSRVPEVKLYIVGSSPGKEILQLTADKSVTVTGFVDDLRPYLSRAWVVVSPIKESFGVKVRVLQAMAMGKPVVSTSMITTGIDVKNGKNIIIADEPKEFAEKVIELINDRCLRESIGNNARLLMETNHSWEKLTDSLNDVLKNTAGEKTAV